VTERNLGRECADVYVYWRGQNGEKEKGSHSCVSLHLVFIRGRERRQDNGDTTAG